MIEHICVTSLLFFLSQNCTLSFLNQNLVMTMNTFITLNKSLVTLIEGLYNPNSYGVELTELRSNLLFVFVRRKLVGRKKVLRLSEGSHPAFKHT